MPRIPTPTTLEPTLVDLIRSATAWLDALVDIDANGEQNLDSHPDWEERDALATDLETIANILRATR